MKIITATQLQTIRDAYEKCKGTPFYLYYHMEFQFKDKNGKWRFCAYTIPFVNHDCKVKTIRGKQYIMQADDERFLLTQRVIDLLNEG